MSRSEINTVATSIANVDLVGGSITNVNTVAGAITNVNLVGGSIANVNTVAGSIANVNAVAANASNINAVAANATNINAVNANATNINTAATNIAAINTVAADLNEPQSEIDTVAVNIANVNTVGTNMASVITVAGIAGDVNTVAGVAPNVTTVAGISANVTTVAGIASSVPTVAGIAADVTAVAAIDTEVTTVAGISSSVVVAATNSASISNFANVYQGAFDNANIPTVRTNGGGPLQLGDLYFNTTDNAMKVYSSAGWTNAGSSVNGTSRRFRYIATASQTTFTGSDSNGNTMAYDAGFVDVYLNGVRLDQTDYTASSGSSIVLASAAALNDELNIVAFGTFSVASINGVDLINSTVTYNKIQNVSASKVLGRNTSGSGVVQELPIAVDSSGNVGIGLNPTARNNTCLQIVNGIGFPSTQVASSDANTLDDYEEGTWTPTDGSGAGLTFGTTQGMYTKIGRMVTAAFNVTFPSTASPLQATISGIPFAASGSVSNPGSGFATYTDSNIVLTAPMGSGSANANIWSIAGGQVTNASLSGKQVRMTVVLFT